MPKKATAEDVAAAERILGGVAMPADLTNVEAYCVPCKVKVEVHLPRLIRMKNGQPAITGDCPKCGSKVFRIGLPDRADGLPRMLPGDRFKHNGFEYEITQVTPSGDIVAKLLD